MNVNGSFVLQYALFVLRFTIFTDKINGLRPALDRNKHQVMLTKEFLIYRSQIVSN